MPTSHSQQDTEIKSLISKVLNDLQKTGSSAQIAEIASLEFDDIPSEWRAAAANILVHHHFHSAGYSDALHYARKWLEFSPDDLNAITSLLAILTRLNQWDEIVDLVTKQLIKQPDNFRLHSSLCQALARLGRLDEARSYGTQCLFLKDKSAKSTAFDLTHIPVPEFKSKDRYKNVISFSLFGNGKKYTQGAIANVFAVRFIYPDWICRFYVDDSVPKDIIRTLTSEGADVRIVQGLPSKKYGTFWRFLVADDKTVDRFLIRDCDSIVNVRERLAVEQWIDSQRHFHVMRDFYTHTDLVQAGMWGGVVGALPPMGQAFCRYVESKIQHRTMDQDFLREEIWSTIRQSIMTHDSFFSFGSYCDFPKLGRLPKGQYVGISML